MATIFISGYLEGGTVFNYEVNPNEVHVAIKNISEDIKALDGTTHRFHRNYKREFKLRFENVTSDIITKLRTVFTTPKQFDFQNEDGTKYTVYTVPDNFSVTLSARTVTMRGIKLYTTDIGLLEI
jgi:hypothetical protein